MNRRAFLLGCVAAPLAPRLPIVEAVTTSTLAASYATGGVIGPGSWGLVGEHAMPFIGPRELAERIALKTLEIDRLGLARWTYRS